MNWGKTKHAAKKEDIKSNDHLVENVQTERK